MRTVASQTRTAKTRLPLLAAVLALGMALAVPIASSRPGPDADLVADEARLQLWVLPYGFMCKGECRIFLCCTLSPF